MDIAVIASLLGAVAIAAPTGPLMSASPERPTWPHLFYAPDGWNCTYSPNECKRSDWLAFLASSKLRELTAPQGGRAYRWFWVSLHSEAYGVPVQRFGYVEIQVDPDGAGRLRASWSHKTARIEAADIAPFELTLARDQFARLPEQEPNDRIWLDYPPEELMESVVGDHYHFVHRIGGSMEPGVLNGGALLEKLAQRLLPNHEHSSGGPSSW